MFDSPASAVMRIRDTKGKPDRSGRASLIYAQPEAFKSASCNFIEFCLLSAL